MQRAMSDFAECKGAAMGKTLKIGELEARISVIQGGMGVGISLSSLAGAVAGEGGIGMISTAQIGFREPDFDTNPFRRQLQSHGKGNQKGTKDSGKRNFRC